MSPRAAARSLTAGVRARGNPSRARRHTGVRADHQIGFGLGAAVPPYFHLLAGAWIIGMLFVGTRWPGQYETILQEDRIVEWGTVWLFGVAGVLGMRGAVSGRRWFDVLVALFCFFVAGEEFSWGQPTCTICRNGSSSRNGS